jgi:HEAT repeat protein
MESNKHLGEDAELDRLLGQAQWPEPRAEQIARLGGHWRSIARRRRMRRNYGILATAASLLVAAGALEWRNTAIQPQATVVAKSRPEGKAIAKNPRESVPEQPSIAPSPVAASRTAEPQPPGSSMEPRDPSMYERVVLMSASANHDRNRRGRVKPQPVDRTIEESLEAWIVALSKNPNAEIGEPLAGAQNDLARCERLLWDIISRGSAERRLGAARVLARIATPRSLPVLIELTNDPTTRGAAILALGRLASVSDLARLASVEPDAKLRRNLLRSLLERRTDESIGIYLDFVNHRGTRADALGAAADMADPPVDLLLAFLESSQKSLRLAAAQALARLPNPQIARRLSGSVLDGIGRQEALVALLLSRSAQAEGVLREARQNLYLVASVQAAEQELHSLTARGGNLP